MVLTNVAWVVYTGLLAVTTFATAHPTSPPKLIHEKRDMVQADWTKVARAEPNTPLTLRIGLMQQNIARAEEYINSVANPDSAQYGKFWTPRQIAETFSASDEALASTEDWLRAEGVAQDRISHSNGKNWIKVKTTVGEAEKFLDTTYSVYKSDDGAEIVACESYSVPAAIQTHIDFVTPTIHLDASLAPRLPTRRDTVIKKREEVISPMPRKGKGPHHDYGHGHDEDLDSCSELTTPACLRALYRIPKKNKAAKGNSFGILQLAPENYNQDDLNMFFTEYASNIPNGTAPLVNKINGGWLGGGPDYRKESNLDLSYGMALTYPQEVTLYQNGDSDRAHPATFNNFLDAIDGEYCSFDGGNDPVWDIMYPHDGSNPDHYTGENMCGAYAATKVISVSYGRDELIRPRRYHMRECNEYMKLGLMGVTVLYASGDRGVQGISGKCKNANNSYMPHGYPGGRFNQVFPASCPWVTAVGGTSLPVNGSVGDREVVATEITPGGGFSDQFDMPAYQAKTIKKWFKHHDPGYNSSVYNNTQTARGFPDLALNAQNYDIAVNGVFWAGSGTSASTPLLGSIITLINAERLKAGKSPVGFINPVLYSHPEVFDDVVEGRITGCSTEGFPAVEGWDPASGLGTTTYPKLLKLFMRLP